MHGGASPSGRAAALNEQIDGDVRAVLAAEGVEPIGDPVLALQLLTGEALRVKEILAAKVDQLRDWTYTDATGAEEVRAVLRAYERALDRAGRLLVSMVKLDLDARLTRIAECQAEQLIRVVERVLDGPELGLDPALRRVGRDVLARELAVVTGPGRA